MTTKMMKAYNFDRYFGACRLGQGITVHAETLQEATEKAILMNVIGGITSRGMRGRSTQRLIFVDNSPCSSACSLCEKFVHNS